MQEAFPNNDIFHVMIVSAYYVILTSTRVDWSAVLGAASLILDNQAIATQMVKGALKFRGMNKSINPQISGWRWIVKWDQWKK